MTSVGFYIIISLSVVLPEVTTALCPFDQANSSVSPSFSSLNEPSLPQNITGQKPLEYQHPYGQDFYPNNQSTSPDEIQPMAIAADKDLPLLYQAYQPGDISMNNGSLPLTNVTKRETSQMDNYYPPPPNGTQLGDMPPGPPSLNNGPPPFLNGTQPGDMPPGGAPMDNRQPPFLNITKRETSQIDNNPPPPPNGTQLGGMPPGPLPMNSRPSSKTPDTPDAGNLIQSNENEGIFPGNDTQSQYPFFPADNPSQVFGYKGQLNFTSGGNQGQNVMPDTRSIAPGGTK